MSGVLRRWRRWRDRQHCRLHGHAYTRRYEPGWPEVDVCDRCAHVVPVLAPNCRCALIPLD